MVIKFLFKLFFLTRDIQYYTISTTNTFGTVYPTCWTHVSLSWTYVRLGIIPVGNYMFKVNNRNTRARCEICFYY